MIGAMRTVLLAALLVLAASCEILAPKVKPKPPQLGTFVSTPFPDVRELNDVIVLAPGVAYAVGTAGTILKLNADKTWAKEESGTTEDLEAISGFLEDDGTGTGTQKEVLLIAGHNGTVLSRTAPGVWSSIPSSTTALLFSVVVRNDTDGFVVGDAGTILRWNGSVLALQGPQTVQDVAGSACPQAGCGGSSTCNPNDGLCHSKFPIPETLHGVGGDNPVLAVGTGGAVYRYDPTGEPSGTRGNTWLKEDSGTTRQLSSVFTKSGVIIPATDGVLVLRNDIDTYDDTAIRTPAPVFLKDVWVDGNDIFAVGLSQEIFYSDRSQGGGDCAVAADCSADQNCLGDHCQQWSLTTVAADAEMRGIDGTEAPPDDEPEAGLIPTFIAVGGGGRIVRGPLVLPVKGESALTSRIATDDFAGR